ncbi:MAG: SprT-like domain-containing protein [Chloroflexi bacterium]|nr:SprT-like domain-containing protein [Chloroflexota bacterium]
MSALPRRASAAPWQDACRQILLGLSLPVSVPAVRLSRRMTWRLGSYRRDRHEIALSYWLVAQHPREALETLKHELAHAIAYQGAPDSRPHGAEWRRACQLLGIAPERCSSIARLGPPRRPRPRYLYACLACGQQVVYQRRLRAPHSCGRCDRRYNPRYRLSLVAQLPAPEGGGS